MIYLVDTNGELVNCAWITSVIDTFSGCVMGYHIGFESPGSHEVALALQQAIASSSDKSVESVYEQPEIPVKPALFVVPDWDEFIEDNW